MCRHFWAGTKKPKYCQCVEFVGWGPGGGGGGAAAGGGDGVPQGGDLRVLCVQRRPHLRELPPHAGLPGPKPWMDMMGGRLWTE